ncbi:MAG: DUF2285 domain-containing protein [Sphingomonas paucimobilis]
MNEFLEAPPEEPTLSDYDRDHLKLYIRLLDADAAGATWNEAVSVLFGLDPATEPDRARQVHAAHLARARWITANGFAQLLTPPAS